MPIHIGDYKRDTGHLRAAEHGAYLLLLFHHWSTGALPTDDRQLASIACMSPAEWKRAKPILVPFFDDGWVHHRVVSDLQAANEKYEKLAGAGKRGGHAKARLAKKASQASQTLQANPGDALATDNRLPIDDDEEASPGGLITPEAMALTEKLLVIAGHDPKFWPPGWCGAPMRVQTWMAEGWRPEIIVAAVQGAAARKRGPPAYSIEYFEKAIAQEVAKQSAPLPKVEIRQAETVTVNHGQSHVRSGNSLIAALDRKLAQLAAEDGADSALPKSNILSLPDGSVRGS